MPTLPLLPPLPGSRAASWSLLLLLSVGLSLLFSLARLPASLLMGPMVAAIILATRGMALRISPLLHLGSQAVIGTMIARMLTPSILGSLRTQWPLLLLVVFSTIAAASFLGWLLGRLRILPGTTAIWGLSPGAASVMMVMAEAYGADARLVAFMQYLRVVVVVTVASRSFSGASDSLTFHQIWRGLISPWARWGESFEVAASAGKSRRRP